MPEPTGSIPGEAPVVPQVTAPSATPVAPISTLPDGASDRTREQFEKLLQSNQRLFESNELLRQEIASRRDAQQTFAPTQTPPAPVPQTPQIDSDIYFVDPTTGMKYIDETKLAQRMEEIKRQASKAEEVVQSYIKTSESREIDRQNREAYGAYPELNPGGEKFDKEFSRQVRSVLIDSMYNADEYGGRPLSFKEAADFIKTRTTPSQPVTTAQDDAAAQAAAQAARSAKEAGSAQVASQPVQAQHYDASDDDIRRLQIATRRGDDRALAERLKHTEHIVPRG